MDITPIIASAVSVLSSAVVGAISWGIRSELATLRTEMQLGLAQAELRFFDRVNGTYVRSSVCAACAKAHEDALKRIDADVVRVEHKVEQMD